MFSSSLFLACDVPTQIVIDAQRDTHKIDQRTLAIRHLDVLEAKVKPITLVVTKVLLNFRY